MKTTKGIFFVSIALALASSFSAKAQIITPLGDLGQITQLPGSSSNYDFVGNSGNNTDTGTGAVGTFELTDFTVTTLNNSPIANWGTSSVIPPGGSSPVQPGTYFSGDYSTALVNLAKFTLSDVGPTSFNYANFDVFVMYSTFDNTGWRDAKIALASGSDATGPSATVIGVSDTNTDPTMGRVVEFNIQGASEGDFFTLALSPTEAAIAAGGGQGAVNFSGISFQSVSVPEPSAWALMLGGLGFLVFLTRRNLRRV